MLGLAVLLALQLAVCDSAPLGIPHVKNALESGSSHLAQTNSQVSDPTETNKVEINPLASRPETDVHVGHRAILKGLAKAEAFNGKIGTIQRWSEALGKYYIKLDGVDDVFTVSPDNVDVVQVVEMQPEKPRAQLQLSANQVISVGDTVALKNLESESAFNGRIAKVIGEPSLDEHGVERLLVDLNGEQFAVKPENLVKVALRVMSPKSAEPEPVAIPKAETLEQPTNPAAVSVVEASAQIPSPQGETQASSTGEQVTAKPDSFATLPESQSPTVSSESNLAPTAEASNESQITNDVEAQAREQEAHQVAKVEPTATYSVGDLVTLKNLANHPAFNGKLGKIAGPSKVDESGAERFVVNVDGDEFAVKPENLAKFSEQETSADASTLPSHPSADSLNEQEIQNEIARLQKENEELESKLAKLGSTQ